ncbi:MAG TPA: hypothetical protein VFX59_00960 [Polyangiales bacterium]|nr:hypothetical protein [Polyangiales bacterium]
MMQYEPTQLTLDALRAAPGLIVEAPESGELARAVQDALRTLSQQHRGVAVFLVPFGPGLERRAPRSVEPARGLVIDEPAHEVQLHGQGWSSGPGS